MSFARQMSPYETTNQDRFMGTILVLSIIIAVYSLSKGSFLGSLTDKRISAHTYFSQSYGVLPGAEITLSGILVGHIQDVVLEERDKIRVSVLLKPEYKNLYREGSSLKVNSNLGLDSVISGKGLELIPGPADAPFFPSGTEISSIEPQSIEDMLDQWNIKELAQHAEKIVSNLATVSDTLVQNQQFLVNTMQNLATTTEATGELIVSLPPVIANINALVLQLNQTVANVDEEAEGLSDNIKELTSSSTALTNNLNALIVDLQPSVALLPSTINQLNRTGRESAKLLSTLNNHWLLGNDQNSTPNLDGLRYIGDDSIYKRDLEKTPTDG